MWYNLVWKKGTTVCPQERKERSRDASGSKSSLQSHENHFLRREYQGPLGKDICSQDPRRRLMIAEPTDNLN